PLACISDASRTLQGPAGVAVLSTLTNSEQRRAIIMRRLAVAAFCAVAVALVGAGATFAGSDHGHGHRGLSFFSTENAFAPLPVTPGKFSVGDRVVFSDDLFTAKGGPQV